MINDRDKDVLLDLILQETGKMNLKREQLFTVERLIYGDYFHGIDGDARPYMQIEDIPVMITKIEEYLEDYNA